MNFLENDSFSDKRNAIANLGDSIQSLAMDSIYEQLGVSPSHIKFIKRDFGAEYNDEEVSLVLYTEFIKNMVERRMSLSKKISIKSVVSAVFYEDFSQLHEAYPACVEKLKQLEPIGARDEKSLQILQKEGIEAYLTGCFTICFPKRTTAPAKKKVFFVDTPPELDSYIPADIKENAEYLSHATQIEKYPVDAEENLRLENIAKNLLERYKNEATLVVTGRLHAAIPCIAFGIPVIFAVKNLDFRFEWIDKLIYPYQFDEFAKIDWYPQPIDVENIKVHFLSYFAHVFKGEDPRPDMKWLNDFYMNRSRIKPYRYFRAVLKEIDGVYGKDNSFSYVIWGAGFHCDYAYELMSEIYPNAKLLAVVDKYKRGVFAGVPIITDVQLNEISFDHLIISTNKGKQDALDWVKKYKNTQSYSLILSQQKS